MSLGNVNAISCLYGRPMCVASCMAQNCASGYCIGATPETQICTCTRCGTGKPSFP
jgi:hypothetical protein